MESSRVAEDTLLINVTIVVSRKSLPIITRVKYSSKANKWLYLLVSYQFSLLIYDVSGTRLFQQSVSLEDNKALKKVL
jgi:hypothetical protein